MASRWGDVRRFQLVAALVTASIALAALAGFLTNLPNGAIP